MGSVLSEDVVVIDGVNIDRGWGLYVRKDNYMVRLELKEGGDYSIFKTPIYSHASSFEFLSNKILPK